MNKLISLLIPVMLFLGLSSPAAAGQYKNIGNLEIHYSSFPSTFLTPDIASNYKIKRSGYSAVVNITVLDTSQPGKPAVPVTLSGEARNLLGTRKQLEFREIREGKAIYYLAEIKHANEESFQFSIDVKHTATQGKLNFRQTFYVD